LFNQIQASSIESNSVAPSGSNSSNAFIARGLRVLDGKSLLLVGGDVSINGGGLYAFGGRVELGGSSGTGTVALNRNGDNFSLSFPDEVDKSDVSLSNNASINVRAGNGGSIAINARNLKMTGASQLLAGIESGLGSDNSKAGNIDINTTGTINLQNSDISNAVRANANGQGGDVNIKTNTLRLEDGGRVLARTLSAGQGGNLKIDATSNVELLGINTGNSSFVSGLFVQQGTKGATGNAGSLTINTPVLRVLDGAEVNAGTSGAGRGGDLIVDANKIEVIGTSSNGSITKIATQAELVATGAAGNLAIKTDQLLVGNGGQVSASTK
jgi:large exoprotein involved in heme utilization and adhesion